MKGAAWILVTLCIAASFAFDSDDFFDYSEEFFQNSGHAELEAGKNYEFKEHSFDIHSGIYRFQNSNMKVKRDVLTLERLISFKSVKCNHREGTITLTFDRASKHLDKIRPGVVLSFGGAMKSGCSLSRNHYAVESIRRKKSSKRANVQVVLEVEEVDPSDLYDDLDVKFYQEAIRSPMNELDEASFEESLSSSSPMRDAAPLEVQQVIGTILAAENNLLNTEKYNKRNLYKKRGFWKKLTDYARELGTAFSGLADSVSGAFESAKTWITSKVSSLGTWVAGTHSLLIPNTPNAVYSRDFEARYSRSWKIKVGSADIDVEFKAFATFSLDLSFEFTITKLKVTKIEFFAGASAMFIGTLEIKGSLQWEKKFQAGGSGIFVNLPTPVPGVMVVINPFCRIDGKVSITAYGAAEASLPIALLPFYRKLTYNPAQGDFNNTGDWTLTKDGPTTNPTGAVTFKVLDAPDAPKGERFHFESPYLNSVLSVKITPTLGIKVGASLLELFKVLAGPHIKIPIRISLISSVVASYTDTTVPACQLAAQISVGVRLGVSLDVQLAGKKLVDKQYNYALSTCTESNGCNDKLEERILQDVVDSDCPPASTLAKEIKEVQQLQCDLKRLEGERVDLVAASSPNVNNIWKKSREIAETKSKIEEKRNDNRRVAKSLLTLTWCLFEKVTKDGASRPAQAPTSSPAVPADASVVSRIGSIKLAWLPGTYKNADDVIRMPWTIRDLLKDSADDETAPTDNAKKDGLISDSGAWVVRPRPTTTTSSDNTALLSKLHDLADNVHRETGTGKAPPTSAVSGKFVKKYKKY